MPSGGAPASPGGRPGHPAPGAGVRAPCMQRPGGALAWFGGMPHACGVPTAPQCRRLVAYALGYSRAIRGVLRAGPCGNCPLAACPAWRRAGPAGVGADPCIPARPQTRVIAFCIWGLYSRPRPAGQGSRRGRPVGGLGAAGSRFHNVILRVMPAAKIEWVWPPQYPARRFAVVVFCNSVRNRAEGRRYMVSSATGILIYGAAQLAAICLQQWWMLK